MVNPYLGRVYHRFLPCICSQEYYPEPLPLSAQSPIITGMSRKPLSMHVATISRKHAGKTYVSHLLRHTYRDGTRVCHRTLANLSHLPEHLIDLIRRSLQGQAFIPAGQASASHAPRPRPCPRRPRHHPCPGP